MTSTSSPSNLPSQAPSYLTSLLNKTLHLHTSDGRIFAGQMKCTDNERNIILAMTQEYRQPTRGDVEGAFEKHAERAKEGESEKGRSKMEMGMKKRFVGLVVVPGRLIERVEVEG